MYIWLESVFLCVYVALSKPKDLNMLDNLDKHCDSKLSAKVQILMQVKKGETKKNTVRLCTIYN